MPCQEIPHRLRRRGRAVSCEGRGRPALRKEDIACALDLGQQFQTRRNESQRVLLSQRVIQIMQRLEHPRLAAPVLDLSKALECLFAHGGVGGKCGHDELEFGFAVGILRAVALRRQDLLPARNFPHSQLLRHRDFVCFGERKAFDLLLPPPYSLQPIQATGRQYHIAERIKPSRLLTGRSRLRNAVAQHGLQCGRPCYPFLRRQQEPERARQV